MNYPVENTMLIKPAKIEGTIPAPSSKSDMQRAVVAAYLTGNRSEITNPSFCDDGKAALGIVEALGVTVDRSSEHLLLAPGDPGQNPVLDCGESGLCLRMFSAIAALRDDEVTLIGHGGLPSRPISMIEEPLRNLGVECHTQNGFLPVKLKGPLQSGKITVNASTTSQFLTGLLMALPVCKGDSELIVLDLKSKPYIEMTLDLLQQFGIEIENQGFTRFLITGSQHYRAQSYNVEGDWSGASFPLVAGAIAGSVWVENLSQDSYQADKTILDVLKVAGAGLNIGTDYVEVQHSSLAGFEFDATDCPDLFPPLVALACYCEGKSIIYGAQRLTVKESDRGTALLTEFRKIGASIELYPDRMEIIGGTPLDGGTVESYHDHRIAMACAVAALGSRQGVTIQDADCVAKSYPEFFEDLKTLAVELKEDALIRKT